MPSEEKTENKDLLVTSQTTNSYIDENNTCRSTMAQYIAGWTVGLSSVSLGLMVSYPTILIGEFRKPNQDFSLNEQEASWIGSLLYLLQPVCSVLAGLMQTYVSRKNGLLITFVPQLMGWLLLSSAKSVLPLYIAMILFGVCVGSLESPTIAYLGEITQPRIRGKLTSSTSTLFCIGYVLLFFLGTIFPCRTVAAICAGFPVISIISVYFIPDSPVWLLNKGRNADALKALCWLRGWVTPDRVQLEYKNMCDYVETSKLSDFSKPRPKKAVSSKLKNVVSNLTNPNFSKPFLLISMCHFACHGATLNGMRSYLIEVLDAMHFPIIKPEMFTFVSSTLMICGGIVCFSVVNYLGKRVTLLLSLTICSLLCIILSVYTFYMDKINLVWIPMAGILSLHFVMAVGAYPIPWMLTSEVFPLKLRSVSTGLAAASCYVQGFIFSKTFYWLNNLLNLSGCFLLYGMCGVVGVVYLYFKLPETEGKTLAEIEEYFSQSPKKRKPYII